MRNTKFIKGHCSKNGQYVALEVKQFGSEWKVVDMTLMSDSDARLLASEVTQDSLKTNDSLLACPVCGNRKVGGCSCTFKAGKCPEKNTYNFKCIYCKHMEVDYSAADISGGREGEIIRLAQGQEVKICARNGQKLSQLYVGVGWDPAFGASNLDLDSSVVLTGPGLVKKDIVYFSRLEHPSGAVIHHGDNLTGEAKAGADDDENISVFLDKVPANIKELYFVLNIYDCKNRRQKLGGVKNMYIRIYDYVTKKALFEYQVSSDISDKTAIIIGKVSRGVDGWKFKAIGKGSYALDVGSLAGECEGF